MKTFTDKQRLDWLQRTKATMIHFERSPDGPGGWKAYGPTYQDTRVKTARQAIDAAIAAAMRISTPSKVKP